MKYYKLPKDKRWMDPGNPYVIGGRDSDVSIIGESLARMIKNWYPTNEVPFAIARKVEIMACHLKISESLIYELIEAVSADIGRRDIGAT